MIKKINVCFQILALVVTTTLLGTQAVQTDSGTTVQDGTPVRIRINRTVSSADAKVGDNVDFEVLDELKAGDQVVIPKGSIALATVTEAQSKRRMGKGGKLNVNIDHISLPTGEKMPLRAVKETSGGGHTGAMTGAIVATSIVFFPAAPLFLFMKGKDITIPKGTEVTAYVNGNFSIDPTKTRSVSAAPPAMTTVPANTVTETATLVAVSVPEGAEITVNGKYAGSTPSTLRLPPGDHVVLIEKTGFRPWQRTLSLSTGSNISISATLDKQ